MKAIFLAAVVMLAVVACASNGEASPAPRQTPATEIDYLLPCPTPTPPPPTYTPHPRSRYSLTSYAGDTYIDTSHEGKATASLEQRIWQSDIVVRANLSNVSPGGLIFDVVEYLKGKGNDRILVKAQTKDRDTQWDGQEAVLFLDDRCTPWEGAYRFTDTTVWRFGEVDWWPWPDTYTGDLPEGYTLSTRNPVWVPRHTLSLDEIREKVAWIEGGDNGEDYDECIRRALWTIREYDDLAAYDGKKRELYSISKIVRPGRAGVVLQRFHTRHSSAEHPRYWNGWTEGNDAGLFSVQIDDDDDDPANGFGQTLTTAKPLEPGVYRFIQRHQDSLAVPCDFMHPETGGLRYVLTATNDVQDVRVEFTLHVRDRPEGIGESNFLPSEVTGLHWADGVVKLETSLPMEDLRMDVMDDLWGRALRLPLLGSEAQEDGALYLWSVPEQPWEIDEPLEVRIYPVSTAWEEEP